MLKRVDIIQNDPEVPSGAFAEFLTEWRVPYHILRADLHQELLTDADAVVVLGGVMGVHDEAAHPFLRQVKDHVGRLLAAGTPLLGICLGGQLLADVTGGTVSSNCRGEKGLVDLTLTAAGSDDPLFAGIAGRFAAFQWHNDSFTVPPGASHLASSALCPGQAFRLGNAWGIQFHPEVDGSIVANWSRDAKQQQQLIAAFAGAEQTHRAMARRLLTNFLRYAEMAG